MRRTLSALALAILLALSGCSALGVGTSGTPTAADAPAVDTPGIENGHLSNGTALLTAHRTALVESGFVTDIQVNATARRRTSNGTRVTSVVRRQETFVERNAGGYRFSLVNQGTGANFDEWANGTARATRLRVGNQTDYRVGKPRPAGQLTGATILDSYLTDDFAVTSVNETDGRTLVTLTSTTPPARNAVPQNATDVRNYEARLVVDEEGRIHSLVVTADYTIDGEDASLRVSYELVRTGVDSVNRPGWVSEAFQSSSSR